MNYPDSTRRGLLGQGSILVQTSLANRTSPVLRGKWVMEVLIGHAATAAAAERADVSTRPQDGKDGQPLTTRERMEIHRKNPTCNDVPPVHGSDRSVARQLRRDRASGAIARTAWSSTRAVRCTTARR